MYCVEKLCGLILNVEAGDIKLALYRPGEAVRVPGGRGSQDLYTIGT